MQGVLNKAYYWLELKPGAKTPANITPDARGYFIGQAVGCPRLHVFYVPGYTAAIKEKEVNVIGMVNIVPESYPRPTTDDEG
jgi:hypothetical protein